MFKSFKRIHLQARIKVNGLLGYAPVTQLGRSVWANLLCMHIVNADRVTKVTNLQLAEGIMLIKEYRLLHVVVFLLAYMY